MAYHSNILSSNTNFSSSSNSDLVNRTANTGVSCDPYIHHSSASRSCPIPYTYTHGGSHYSQLEHGGSMSASNSEADYERAYFKRKSSVHPMSLDARTSDEYYCTRSSNRRSITSDQYMTNPISGPHSRYHSSISLLPGYMNNGNSTIGEGSGSHRNVRSRHGQAFRLENKVVGPQASSSLSHHFHQSTSISGHVIMSSDSSRRFPSSGFFHQEMNQPIEHSGADIIMETSEGFSYVVSSRDRATLVPSLPTIPMQDDINYGYRLNPYSSSSSYTSVGFQGTMENVRQSENEVFPHSRHHRPSSLLGQSNVRYGRMRSSYDILSHRMNAVGNEGNNARDRWNTEDATMIDSSVLSDPRAMFDQHRNMRMDIDNMSYEELVDLGESIGNVSTGLSGGDITRCLTSVKYSFDWNKDVEKGSCAICLEEYKDGQSIGRLNCRHDFHSRCIKKWLLIKNSCPICKSAALDDKVKGKQVLFM